MKPKDFKTLQTLWYQKLKDAGFEDIEDTNGGLKSPSFRTNALRDMEAVFDYFNRLSARVMADEDLSKNHRKVLQLYCTGIRLEGPNGICEQTGYSARGIQKLIKRYTQDYLRQTE